MKWRDYRKSDNVEDTRGMSGTGKAVLGGGGLIGIIAFLLMTFGGEQGQQIGNVINQMQPAQQETTVEGEQNLTPEQQEIGDFAKTMFAMNEDTWTKIFKEEGLGEFPLPKMRLFSGSVETACGSATSASGPFYCPADKKVYMDLDFFEELKTRFGAKGGDFAIAYVIAHEVGHHVQTVLGTSSKVRQAQQNKSEEDANKLSVCQELQADFYAGLWAKYNQDRIEVGDLEEAIDAAHAVGDDAIQSKMQGHVQPEKFTHGTSAQRKKWFTKGFQTGDFKQHNTFAEEL
jgi:predicted metalloprotease